MNIGKYIFVHVIDFIPHYQFDNLLKKHNADWNLYPRPIRMAAYHDSVTGNDVEFIASVLVQFHEEEAHLRNQEQTSPNMPPKSIPRYFAKFSLLSPYRHYFTFYFTIPLYRLILNLQMFDPNHTQPSLSKVQ